MSSKCHSSISAVGCILSLQENARKIWGAVVRGVSSQKAPQQDSGTVTSITPCPRTGLLEQVTPAGWEDAHRDRVRHCGLYGLLYGLKCWKIKQLLHLFAFLLSCMLCFPYIPYIYIHLIPYISLYAHLLFAVHSAVPSLCCWYPNVNRAVWGWIIGSGVFPRNNQGRL